MSKKSDATSAMRSAAKQAGGSHATLTARMGTAGKFIEVMYELGYQISGPQAIAQRHVAAYAAKRLADGASPRTLQNEMSHVRGCMRAVDRSQAAADPGISNKALGAGGASRAGTKTSATESQYQAAVAATARINPGVAACLHLQRTLGLRAMEAIRSPASLKTWERQLSTPGGGRVSITFGTKGGRLRESLPADRTAALEAVRGAQRLAASQGGQLIPGTLRQAQTAYRNTMHRHAGINGHALRYSYAQDRLADYKAEGFTADEARARASIDLGHGDGRGRYVERVYSRSASDET